MSAPSERLADLDRLARAYGELHLAVAFTDGTEGDAAKRISGPWNRTRPLASPEFATGLMKRCEGRNPAIVVGASGLIGIDIDGREGLECFREVVGKLPATVTVTTGKGAHLYFTPPEGGAPDQTVFEFGAVTTEAPKGVKSWSEKYLVAPPALHPSGRMYHFSEGLAPWEIDLAELPIEALEAMRFAAGTRSKASTNGAGGGPIAEGGRNDALFRMGCMMRRRGMSQAAILAALSVENAARCRPPLDGDEVESIAESAAGYAPAPETAQGYAVNAEYAESLPGDASSDPYRVNRVNRVLGDKWPEPLAPAALHGLAGEFVELVEPQTEADPAALLIDLLVQVGHAVGRTAHVRVGAVNHYANTYAVIVGPSGAAGRKGTAHSEARRLLERAAREAAARIVGGAASGEGIIWNVRDPVYGLDKKGNEVMIDEGVDDKRLLLREAEFSQVLRVAGRDSNTLSIVLREAWDGGARLQTLAKNSPVTATGAHVSLIADITPAELRRELTATDKANGFGNRILWCCSRRSKELPDGGRVDSEALERLAVWLGAALADAHLMGRVERDEEARQLWHSVYGDLTRERPGLLGALLARAEAQVVRLSLIYAVLDGRQTIKREHLEAALAVWAYCERSAEYLFGDALGDPVADELLDALRRSTNGMTRNELRDHFGRNRSSADIGHALALLERHGLARVEREQTGGRPAERWYAVQSDGGAS